MVLGAAACGSSRKPVTPVAVEKTEEPKASPEDAWKQESLSLAVQGYMFSGATQPEGASWAGSGSWIGPNTVVTNAHVALRGLKIIGTDDLGKTFEFDQILAVDEEADLAIIKASGTGSDIYLKLAERPEDPRSLRGTNVRVIGNTGGLGLSFYDGRITNVVGKENTTVLLHDANTAGGSSGGPLINPAGDLVGVNHSSLPSLNAKAAAPSWVVKDVVSKAGAAKSLKDAFDPADLPVSWYVERAVCLKPGEMFKGAFATVATNDLVAEITPAQATPIGFVVHNGQEAIAEAVVTGKAQGAWTLRGGGQYVFAVLNPKDAPGPNCATVKFGRIDWAARFK